MKRHKLLKVTYWCSLPVHFNSQKQYFSRLCHNESHGVSNHRYLDCVQPFVLAHIKENIKALRYWPLTQRASKYFHLLTSSWRVQVVHSKMNFFINTFRATLNNFIKRLWPSDAIWPHRFQSTLAQVMACSLTAPSDYLNQCWIIISGVLWHLHESSFTRNVH